MSVSYPLHRPDGLVCRLCGHTAVVHGPVGRGAAPVVRCLRGDPVGGYHWEWTMVAPADVGQQDWPLWCLGCLTWTESYSPTRLRRSLLDEFALSGASFVPSVSTRGKWHPARSCRWP